MTSDLETRLSSALRALGELTAESDLRPAADAMAELRVASSGARRPAAALWIRPVLAAAAAAAILVGTTVGIAHLHDGGGAPPAVAPTVSPTPSISATPASELNPGKASGDFVDDERGWIVTASTRCSGCLDLSETTDGGAHWTTLPNPPAELPQTDDAPHLHFADRESGYLFGGAQTFATHDGGLSWHLEAPTQISDIVGAGGHVYALSDPDASNGGQQSAILWRSVGSGHWTKSILPGQDGQTDHRWQIAAQDGELVVLRTDGPSFSGVAGPRGALWSSADGGATWQARPAPCRLADGGATAISVALGHPLAWLVDCFSGNGVQQAQTTQHHLYGTADGGARWVQLEDPSSNGDDRMLADNGAGHAFLATVSGSYDALSASVDGGATWKRAITSPDGGGFAGWADLQFTSADVGYALEQNVATGGLLYRTSDGGITWQKRPVPTVAKTISRPSASQSPKVISSPSGAAGLVPPDTTLPPAHGCGGYDDSVVTITINPDGAMPNCAIVTKTQRLRVLNATNAFSQPGAVITVNFAGLPQRVLQRGQATTFDQPLGRYLAPGEHFLTSSYHGDSNIIIWLK